MTAAAPSRIVCLSAEAADWMLRLGVWDRVAGVTAYFQAPAGTPRKPVVSGFSTARLDEITRLRPDLILAFSDVQAPLVAELLRAGFPVLATNPRSLAEVEDTLLLLARVVDRAAEAAPLIAEFRRRTAATPSATPAVRVYFEEWDEPPVTCIAWISELIERAGGIDVFAASRGTPSARDRAVTLDQVLAADPQVILTSWCGRPFRPESVRARPGWDRLAPVRDGCMHEIPAEEILQPGFRLAEGCERMRRILGGTVG